MYGMGKSPMPLEKIMKIKQTSGIQSYFGSLDNTKQCAANAMNPNADTMDEPTYNVYKRKRKIFFSFINKNVNCQKYSSSTFRLNLSTKFRNTKLVNSVVMEMRSDEFFSESVEPVLSKMSVTYAGKIQNMPDSMSNENDMKNAFFAC